jgi:hypothetical protein
MRQDRDYEDILRRALAAAAESIEPGGDGLQRIRHRLDSHRSSRSVFSGFAESLDLHGTRLLVRLDPLIEGTRGALRRTGPLSGPLLALASFIAGLFSQRGRRRVGGHRGPRGHASPLGRLGSAGAWLKPVFAVSAAVAIVVVGVVILNHETGPLINPANSFNNASPGSSPNAGPTGGGTTASSKRWKLPLGISPTQPFTEPGQHGNVGSTMPAVACTATPKPAAAATAPGGKATATPTPTVSGTGTGTPTPQPTDTVPPTPTPTASSYSGGTATATTAALSLPYDAAPRAVVECGTGTKTTAKAKPTTAPAPTRTP